MQTSTSSDTPRLQTLSREVFWQRHIAQWRESGLSRMAYCQQYSLVYHQMVYWFGKLAKNDKGADRPSNDFVSVSVTPTFGCASSLSIRLPNGIAIEGIDEHSIAWVGKLVEQL